MLKGKKQQSHNNNNNNNTLTDWQIDKPRLWLYGDGFTISRFNWKRWSQRETGEEPKTESGRTSWSQLKEDLISAAFPGRDIKSHGSTNIILWMGMVPLLLFISTTLWPGIERCAHQLRHFVQNLKCIYTPQIFPKFPQETLEKWGEKYR